MRLRSDVGGFSVGTPSVSLPERGTEVSPIVQIYGTEEYLRIEALARDSDRSCVWSGKVVLCLQVVTGTPDVSCEQTFR